VIAYVDSSVLARAYLVDEDGHDEATALLANPDIATVTGTWTRIEVSGALVRAARGGRADEKGLLELLDGDLAGPVIVLGYLATALIATVEGAAIGAGVTALAAALYSVGVPKDSVLAYEGALKSNGFLVMAHGSSEEILRAKAIMQIGNARKIDTHEGGPWPEVKPMPVMIG
jgi:predicted nucleic acid-binding protein